MQLAAQNKASRLRMVWVLVMATALGLAGCKAKPSAPDDNALAASVQQQISADTALTGEPVQAAVAGGVAILNGSVGNDAQKTLAARDAAGVAGIKEVRNNLSVVQADANVTVSETPRVTIPVPDVPAPRALPRPTPTPPTHQAAPIERLPPPQQQQAYNPPAPPPPVPQAPPPPQPTFRNVTIPSGDTLPVRVTQTLDSATTQQGDAFSGVVASDILIDGMVAIPAGSAVSGHVDAVQEAAHFKGSSLLTVSLSSVSRKGERIPVSTDPYTVQGKGRGKNTAEKTGGGAAVGAILGGIFGGGKGAAIGAAAGGGVGAGSNAVTRGEQVQIPSETVVRFHLTSPISVRVRTNGDHGDHAPDASLQPRN